MDKKNLFAWIIRVVIAALFLVSAAAKLYPSPYFAISTFEVKQLYTLGFSENIAPFFSRILIGIELALGLLILQNSFLKKIIIPATLAMLVVFTTHLSIVTFTKGGNSGNCGCFGSLLPMTPIEAIVKNLIAIVLLVILLFLLQKKNDISTGFWKISTVTLASVLALFMITFSQPKTVESNNLELGLISNQNDTTQEFVEDVIVEDKKNVSEVIVATKTTATPKQVEAKIPLTKSGYAKYFSNIDKGEKIICFFVPGCEHCRATATEINQLKAKNINFPEISILFMDEEANLIPEFFSVTGANHPYKIVDIIGFWKILGTNKDVPGVKLLRDGKEIKYYYGTTDNQFSGSDLMKLLQK